MMTYRSLKTFIFKNTQPHNINIFDLIPLDIKSKIIFVVGDGSNNTASFLTSIMSACELKYSHFTNNNIDINNRFLQDGKPVSMESLCENAEKILKATKKMLSNDDLLFCLALSFCKSEYAVIEISEEYYNAIKNSISPFAIIVAIKDDEKANNLIENAHSGVKEIISLSQKDNFDYISSKTSPNGSRVSLASPNKITISDSNLLGTSFYHYSYLYHIPALDLNNVALAHLSIEAASVLFSAPRPYIYKGLENAKLYYDLKLYSLSPTVLVWNGKGDFSIHHKLKYKIDEIKNEST